MLQLGKDIVWKLCRLNNAAEVLQIGQVGLGQGIVNGPTLADISTGQLMITFTSHICQTM